MKLKPCPFCGEHDIRLETCEGSWCHAYCFNCCAQGPFIDTAAGQSNTIAEKAATLAWNRRGNPRKDHRTDKS